MLVWLLLRANLNVLIISVPNKRDYIGIWWRWWRRRSCELIYVDDNSLATDAKIAKKYMMINKLNDVVIIVQEPIANKVFRRTENKHDLHLRIAQKRKVVHLLLILNWVTMHNIRWQERITSIVRDAYSRSIDVLCETNSLTSSMLLHLKRGMLKLYFRIKKMAAFLDRKNGCIFGSK